MHASTPPSETTVLETVVLEAVSSIALGALVYPDEQTRDLVLYSGISEQLGENRWTARPLWSQTGPRRLQLESAQPARRGAVTAIGTSTWTTAGALPTGVIANAATGRSIAWQIEHNGGWRWEVTNVREVRTQSAWYSSAPKILITTGRRLWHQGSNSPPFRPRSPSLAPDSKVRSPS